MIGNCFLLLSASGLVYYNSYLTHILLCEKNNQVTPDECYSDPELGLQVLSYILFAMLLIYIVLLILQRKNRPFGFELLKATSEPLKKIKKIMLVPFFLLLAGLMILGTLIFIFLWSLSIGYINTLENNKVPGGYVNSLSFQTNDKAIVVYIVFMSFWLLSFFIGIGDFVMGGAIGSWYFTKEKSTIFSPVSVSISNCIKYHLGSVARGSVYSLLFKFPIYILSFLNTCMKIHKKSTV